ncbi:hypothetical protein [Streptomyces sp. NPDC018947]|uniref:hypothetical protein n=1 Tax=Streptomyces sp. NPDC018947 TaxID=3365054 RepID=UPI003794DC86
MSASVLVLAGPLGPAVAKLLHTGLSPEELATAAALLVRAVPPPACPPHGGATAPAEACDGRPAGDGRGNKG